MKSNKGFTLTEVLLAVMIVGLVGVALAALTGTSVRESNVGRTRMMLRNQASIALRQLRQDVHQASSVICDEDGKRWELKQKEGMEVGPENPSTDSVIYTFDDSEHVITRGGESWLELVRRANCTLDYAGVGVNSILKVHLVIGVDSEPPITETLEETFLLPHGVAIKE